MMASYVASPEAEVQEVHYKQLLDNIGAQLDTNAVNFLITLHNLPVITAQGLDPEPFHVLQSMEEKGILSQTNLKTLSISLKRVGKKNLVEMIKKYERNQESALIIPKQETARPQPVVHRTNYSRRSFESSRPVFRTSSEQTTRNLQTDSDKFKMEIEHIRNSCKMLQEQLELFLTRYQSCLLQQNKSSLDDCLFHITGANHSLDLVGNLSQEQFLLTHQRRIKSQDDSTSCSHYLSEQQFDTARQQSQSPTVDQPQGLRAGQTPSDSTRSSLSLRRH